MYKENKESNFEHSNSGFYNINNDIYKNNFTKVDRLIQELRHLLGVLLSIICLCIGVWICRHYWKDTRTKMEL